jgi:hypothetical protein
MDNKEVTVHIKGNELRMLTGWSGWLLAVILDKHYART